jgi:predicted transposase/invertase (TIGR01784 family)
MSRLDRVPAVLNKRVFQKVFKIAEVSNLTREEKAMYDSNLKAKWDYENSIAFAEEKAEERGEHKKALDIARKLKKMGLAIEDIAKGTGLSIEEIEKL